MTVHEDDSGNLASLAAGNRPAFLFVINFLYIWRMITVSDKGKRHSKQMPNKYE
jgi:hypothetical protein